MNNYFSEGQKSIEAKQEFCGATTRAGTPYKRRDLDIQWSVQTTWWIEYRPYNRRRKKEICAEWL